MEGFRRKLSLYFPQDMIDEMAREARRLDRPLQWLLEQAWQIARAQGFVKAARMPEHAPAPSGHTAR
jgi:uncharacterized small protein (TIGR04563 family)